MTAESLQLILEVLKPEQTVDDVMEGSNDEDEEMEEEENQDGEEEEDEKMEDEDKEDGDEDEESDEEEEDEVVESGDQAFSEDVRRALGAAAAVNSDGEVRCESVIC